MFMSFLTCYYFTHVLNFKAFQYEEIKLYADA